MVDETRFLLHSADFAERFGERRGGSEADNVFGRGRMPQSAETVRVCGGGAAINADSSSFPSVGVECDARAGHRIDPERD